MLNIPTQAGERRLKCPHCAARFVVTELGIARIENPYERDRSAASSVTATLDPVPHSRMPERSRLSIDHFDPGLTEANAAALFKEADVRPREAPGDARRRVRECPNCGHSVPAGMSLCVDCEFDLDTGQFVTTPEVVETIEPPPLPEPEMPVGSMLVGWASAIVGIGLVVGGLLGLATNALTAIPMAVGAFVTYTSILYLLGKAHKPLALGLGLALACILLFLVILPVADAAAPHNLGETASEAATASLLDRIDYNRMLAGAALVFSTTFMIIYLTTRSGRAFFLAKRAWLASVADA